jgi:hypothetical protein
MKTLTWECVRRNRGVAGVFFLLRRNPGPFNRMGGLRNIYPNWRKVEWQALDSENMNQYAAVLRVTHSVTTTTARLLWQSNRSRRCSPQSGGDGN